jgi:hypothetical protein
MQSVTGEELLAAETAKVEWVPLPEFLGEGKGVYVRRVMPVERDLFEVTTYTQGAAASPNGVDDPRRRLRNLRARLVVLCACDADGKRIFRDDQAEALGTKAGASAMVDTIYDAAKKLNRMYMSEKETDAAAKNFEGAPSASFGSSSATDTAELSASCSAP